MLKGGTRGLSGELQEQKRGAQGTTKEGAETSMWHRQGHDNLQHDNSCRTIAEAADENVVVRGRAWSCNTVYCERSIGRTHVMALASSKNCPANLTMAFSS